MAVRWHVSPLERSKPIVDVAANALKPAGPVATWSFRREIEYSAPKHDGIRECWDDKARNALRKLFQLLRDRV